MAEGRLRRPRFLGFDPSRRPTTPGMCLAHREVATPLGFALLGFAREGLGRDSAQPPLTRFSEPAMNASAARRPRVSIDLRLTLLTARRASTYEQDQGDPYRVSAPAQSLVIQARGPILAMGSPLAVPYITAGQPTIFGSDTTALPELPGLA
jgi:hypothetical protein